MADEETKDNSMDPQTMLLFGKLIIEILESIPRDGMSEEQRLVFAQKVEAAKIMLAAGTPAEKKAAMEMMGKVIDENPLKK